MFSSFFFPVICANTACSSASIHADTYLTLMDANMSVPYVWQVMLSHLRTQLAQAQVCSEQVSVLKIRETALETQVKQLTEEVREAKRNHTPVSTDNTVFNWPIKVYL